MADFNNDKQRLTDLVSDEPSDCHMDAYDHKDMYWGGSLVWFILAFVFIFIIVFLVIYTVKPTYIYGDHDYDEDCDDNSWGSALLAAFVISLIIVIIIGFMYALSSSTASDC